jgi:hypothetical protein
MAATSSGGPGGERAAVGEALEGGRGGIVKTIQFTGRLREGENAKVA